MSQWPFDIPPDLEWIKRIRKGDVLKAPSGRLRIVRAVSHDGPSLPKTHVTFAIAHCSWTHRCYTTYTGNDLRQYRYRPVRAKAKLPYEIDRKIEHDIVTRDTKDLYLDCCDVRGLP